MGMELAAGVGILGFLMLVCLLSSKISSFINMPCLLLFLAVGMLAGGEGLNVLHLTDPRTANYLGSAALAFILFSGGFDTEWKPVQEIFLTGGLLSTLGVLLTALFTGLFTWGLFFVAFPAHPMPLSWCLLLGAIISSTDAAAVFSILRSQSVSLRGNLRVLLEFESGSNDPMAAFLTVFMVGIILTEQRTGASMPWRDYWTILPWFLVRMPVGLITGFLAGHGAAWLYNKINFEYNGLYYALGIVVVLLTFALSELLWGNGFMAVYVAGVVMGREKFVFHNGVGRFYDGLAWIMQVVLFAMLGVLAAPSHVWRAKWSGLAVAVFLMLGARPLATFISMWRSPFTVRERALVSWVGLRGGAPIMLATFPLLAGVSHADFLFHIVFFIVLTSVLLQGMTIMPAAKLLGLDAPLQKMPRVPLSLEETGDRNADSRELAVSKACSGKTLAELDLPEKALVLLIRRDDHFLVPRGYTVLRENDVLTIMGTPEAMHLTEEKLQNFQRQQKET